MMSETLLLSFLIVAMVVFAAVSYLSWRIFNSEKLKDNILKRMEDKLDSMLSEDKIGEDKGIKENEW